MFRRIENLLDPTAPPPSVAPPNRLGGFYWHFIRQVRPHLAALFLAGLCVALLDATIPVFLGRIVGLLTSQRPETLFPEAGTTLLAMAGVLLIARPAAIIVQSIITNLIVTPGLTNLVRWQSHFHVVRQGWGFFQNDFAGRLAARVMQTGPSLRDSVVQGANAVWYILVYGTSAITLLASADWWLALPMLAWFAAYAALLRAAVPRLRDRSRAASEARANLTGRVVDSYTNILTVKLFARARDEDEHVREGVVRLTEAFRRQMRMTATLTGAMAILNACLLAATGLVAILLWRDGAIGVAAVAMALPLAWQIISMAGWVAQSVASIFESIGVVQDGVHSIAAPRQMPDRPGAQCLRLEQGEIRFEAVRFGYGRRAGVLRGIDLVIPPGQRVGLVGPSGAGKSTLVNLLLRFFDPEEGRILIDGQEISTITQESLRAAIGVVTQDTSLLHRSIRDNIRYGRPDAAESMIRDAARQASADGFIESLEDPQGRRGYDAHVGERGVKLSGGQRQRIALARVILKDAPILVLDEATASLDSEVEAAIQEQLDTLMRGRTVIAIAHRLSTIARMDRLIVLDESEIAEQGTHAELLARGGVYARLWTLQSHGFSSIGGQRLGAETSTILDTVLPPR